MFTTVQLLCTFLLPLFLGVVLASVGRDLGTGRARWGLAGALLALVVVVAHGAAAIGADAAIAPPMLGWHWLPWAALVLAGVLLFAAPRAAGRGRPLGVAALGLTAGAGAALILHCLFSYLGPGGILAWSAAVAAIAAAGAWTTVRYRGGPIGELFAAGIAAAGVAVGAGLTGSKDLALLALIIPLGIAGLGAMTLIRRTPVEGLGPAVAVLTSWHLAIAATFSEMPWWTALLFALPLPAGALAAGFAGRRTGVVRCVVTLALVIVAVAVAALLAQPAAAGGGSDPAY